jgi:prefoldin subunit 5
VKTAGAIRHQLKQIRFRYLKKLIEEALAAEPGNCIHHRTVHPPLLHQPIDVCFFPEPICEDLICSFPRAQTCPHFETQTTKEEIKADFKDFLSTATLAQIAARYPDLAALLWVLYDEAPNREAKIDAAEDWDAEDTEEDGPLYLVEIGGIHVQCSSEEEREAVADLLDGYATTIKVCEATTAALELCQEDKARINQEREDLEEERDRLRERLTELEDESHQAAQANALLTEELDRVRSTAKDIREELTKHEGQTWWSLLWGWRSNG